MVAKANAYGTRLVASGFAHQIRETNQSAGDRDASGIR
jgi:hypothetical protein